MKIEKQLPWGQCQFIGEFLTLCTNIVFKKIQKNKSPGIDGIPIEFYQTFWDLLKELLIQVYDTIYNEGELSSSQRKSVISLIHKDNEKNLLKNYRPISLTNTDYKILAFAL